MLDLTPVGPGRTVDDALSDRVVKLKRERDELRAQNNALRGEVALMKRYRLEEAEKADATIVELRERVKVLEDALRRARLALAFASKSLPGTGLVYDYNAISAALEQKP